MYSFWQFTVFLFFSPSIQIPIQHYSLVHSSAHSYTSIPQHKGTMPSIAQALLFLVVQCLFLSPPQVLKPRVLKPRVLEPPHNSAASSSFPTTQVLVSYNYYTMYFHHFTFILHTLLSALLPYSSPARCLQKHARSSG
jgi:hypothetical protein